MKCLILFLSFFLFVAPTYAEEALKTREARMAGSFYPENPQELFSMVDSFLQNVPVRKGEKKERIIGLVVPHAGYRYSGQVAAYAYKQIQETDYDTVFLIGTSHHKEFSGVSVWPSGEWETPLGKVKVDREMAEKIAQSNPLLQHGIEPHLDEHTLEVQLPFLQKILKKFEIVPILTGDLSPETAEALGVALATQYKISKKKMLFVFSTDMSHEHKVVDAARMDRETMDLILRSDFETLRNRLVEGESELCGAGAILALLKMQEKIPGAGIHYLKYSHSGEVSGGTDAVVGYGAFAFIRNFSKKEKADIPVPAFLKIQQRQKLLQIARESVQYFLQHGEKKEYLIEDPVLEQPRAVFVTIRKNEELQGCIGDLLPESPLFVAVQDNAVLAAVSDARFKSMELKDMADVRFEISVLSLPEKITTPGQIEIGRHGVILQKGEKSGVFLPKVAKIEGWTSEKLLQELCSQKAGLPENCWTDPDTSLFVFSTEDFKE